MQGKKSEETLQIRLYAVDCPEVAHFGNPAQPLSTEAKEVRSLLLIEDEVTDCALWPEFSMRVRMAFLISVLTTFCLVCIKLGACGSFYCSDLQKQAKGLFCCSTFKVPRVFFHGCRSYYVVDNKTYRYRCKYLNKCSEAVANFSSWP